VNEIKHKGSKLYLVGVCFVATIGGFLFGYDTAIISGCNTFLQSQFQLGEAGLGWVASSALVGTIAGCLIAGFFADRIGRKKTLLLAALCLTVSATGSMLTPIFLSRPEGVAWFATDLHAAFDALVIARAVGGVGVGITAAVAPVYISELTRPDNRGKMVSIYQLSITLGILFAFLVDWLVLSSAGSDAGVIAADGGGGFFHWAFVQEIWRGMFGTEIPIAALFFVLLFLTPESPRWLVAHERETEAMAVLSRVGGSEVAEGEMREIKETLQEEVGGFRELLSPHLRIPLMIGILLPMFSHLSGIAAVMYFTQNILNESFKNVESAFLGAVLVGAVNTAFTFVAISLIDRCGRRLLLLVGVTGAMLSLAGVGILFAVGSKLVILPLVCYVACFAFSYGPIVWTIIGEIFPTRIRGVAAALGSLSLWITAFVITFTNPMLIESISAAGTFFVYAGLTVPAIWFIWRFVPETKGRSLEDIERSWFHHHEEQANHKLPRRAGSNSGCGAL
jgi:SP family arabinose:H+ symporter-like MFS transporter